MLVSRDAGAHFVTMSQKQSSVQEEDTVGHLLRVSLRGPVARPDWIPWGKAGSGEQPGCRGLSEGGVGGSQAPVPPWRRPGQAATVDWVKWRVLQLWGRRGPVLAPGDDESAGNCLLALTHPPQACHSFPRLPPPPVPHPPPSSAGSRGATGQPQSRDGRR